MNTENQPDYSQPVAYDNQGRPLYAHPPGATVGQQAQPQMVYVARPMQPEKPRVPEEVQKKHEESKRLYPQLNLSYGEYVISAVKRHPIGIIQIWMFVLVLVGVFGAMTAMFLVNGTFGGDESTAKSFGLAGMMAISILSVMGGMVATYVYNNNRFYLTNESVIQEIQSTLFSRHEQTVSLLNIEDASFEQHGILPHLLNYGRIRLSTEGDETTYRFSYVSDPKTHIAILNNAVEAYKNGRPVHND